MISTTQADAAPTTPTPKETDMHPVPTLVHRPAPAAGVRDPTELGTGTPTPSNAAVTLTHGSVDTPAALALDLVLGERPEAANCPRCGRHMPALEAPRFELETPEGEVCCLPCCDKAAHGVRLAVAVLNAALEARQAGDSKTALETISAIVNGLELLDEQTPRPAYRRPVRHQPRKPLPRRGRRG